jgi:NitT/TauT family transport system substrate-binding protein
MFSKTFFSSYTRNALEEVMRFITLLFAAQISSTAFAQTAICYALDWRFEGPAAPYFVAIDKGYYKAEGLDVTIDPGTGSVEGINRVASGVYQMGLPTSIRW